MKIVVQLPPGFVAETMEFKGVPELGSGHVLHVNIVPVEEKKEAEKTV